MTSWLDDLIPSTDPGPRANGAGYAQNVNSAMAALANAAGVSATKYTTLDGSDNSGDLQTAANAAAGSILRIESGLWIIRQPIVISDGTAVIRDPDAILLWDTPLTSAGDHCIFMVPNGIERVAIMGGVFKSTNTTGAYDASKQQNHAIRAQNADRILVANCRFEDLWGDGVTFEDEGGGGIENVGTTNSRVVFNDFVRVGRQGVAVICGTDNLTGWNNLEDATIDQEQNSGDQPIARNDYIGNKFKAVLKTSPTPGTLTEVGLFVSGRTDGALGYQDGGKITDNTVVGGRINVENLTGALVQSNHVTKWNGSDSDHPPLRFYGIDRGACEENYVNAAEFTAPFTAGKAALLVQGCTDSRVRGNTASSAVSANGLGGRDNVSCPINGNVSKYNGGAGITADFACLDLSIDDNVCQDNNPTNNLGFGGGINVTGDSVNAALRPKRVRVGAGNIVNSPGANKQGHSVYVDYTVDCVVAQTGAIFGPRGGSGLAVKDGTHNTNLVLD